MAGDETVFRIAIEIFASAERLDALLWAFASAVQQGVPFAPATQRLVLATCTQGNKLSRYVSSSSSMPKFALIQKLPRCHLK